MNACSAPRRAPDEEHLSAFLSWAQRDPEWTDARANEWREEVAAFAAALRGFSIDVDLDLHRQSERGIDWTRFGQRAVVEKDWVVALSAAWRDRWDGTNEPTEGAGAAAEANALRSVFAEDQDEFAAKVVLVILPSMLTVPKLIPTGLHGVQRRRIKAFGLDDMTDLLRLLTTQPAHPPTPLGPRPVLPPQATHPAVAPAHSQQPPSGHDRDEEHRRQRGIWLMPTKTLSSRELLDAAGRTPGAPEGWNLIYDGMLLVQPPDDFTLRGAEVGAALKAASGAAAAYVAAHLGPTASGHLLKTLARDWQSHRPREWSCGSTSADDKLLTTRETTAALLVTSSPVLTVDRTIPNAVRDATGVVYRAAYEPVIAADVIACCALAASLFAPARECDIAVLVSAAPHSERLVSAESYAGNHKPFNEPHQGIRPPAVRAATYHLESTRSWVSELARQPEQVARTLLDDWLVTFRDEDLFRVLHPISSVNPDDRRGL